MSIPSGERAAAARLVHDRGFAFLGAGAFRAATALPSWAAFAASWDDLGVDAYLPRGDRFRTRRFGSFTCDREGQSLKRCPSGPFYQSPDVNAVAGGVERDFMPLDPAIADGDCLKRLIRADLALFQDVAGIKRRAAWWKVQVHQIRITASPDRAVPPAPEGIHRDGHDFLAIHLLTRRNVLGGESLIYNDDRQLLHHATLSAPMDSIVLDDVKVMHDVEPVTRGPGTGPSYRDTLLIDFNIG